MQINFQRTNFHGRSVSLCGGAAVGILLPVAQIVTGRGNSAALQVAVAAAGSGAAGFFDDMSDSDTTNKSTKGLRGHIGALKEGRLSPGLVKMLALMATGAVAARPRRDVWGWLIQAGVIAGSANLINLLDLRAGRALKVALLGGLAGFLPAHSGCYSARRRMAATNCAVIAAALPLDLREVTMLGDTGANALGAALGATWSQGRTTRTNLVTLGAIAALTLASEKISFSKVIESHQVLKAGDDWGRLPA